MSKPRILYGVQGTGNGHISRARMLAEHFSHCDADVTYLFSGRNHADYFAMEAFGDYQHRQGLTFSTRAGKVEYLNTIKSNNILRFYNDVRALDLTDFDLVISDFEPITAWAAKKAGKTSIGLGHQYAFDFPIPMAGQNPATRLVMRYFAPTTYRVGLHWSAFGQPILPPIVDTNLKAKRNGDDYRLVYLPLEDQQQVTQLLNRFPEQQFIQYAPNLTDSEQGNTRLRKNCLQGFRDDLAACSGVICNAGFALISECLHMGVPVLTKPLNGQMEQQSNALALEQLGLAEVMYSLSASTIEHWLVYEQPHQPASYPDVAAALVKWILAGNWNNQSLVSLSHQLWNSSYTR